MQFFWLFLSLSAIGAGFVLGAAFSAMEAAVLALNRVRLLELFGDEQTESANEQNIFRDTKDIYFVSRLGLCATLALAGVGVWTLSAQTAINHALLFLALPPAFLFAVHGAPFLLLRQNLIESVGDLPRWMRGFIRLVRPLAGLKRLSVILRVGRSLPRHKLTKNDLVALVTDIDIDEEEELVESARRLEEKTPEEEIIYNILNLEETFAREAMRPINTVVALRLETATVQTTRDLARSTGFSRFPVYHDRIVNLTGYVSIYDILDAPDADSRSLESFVTPAVYVPEFMRVSALLQEFLNHNIDAAIVVDEHGGSSGWITREDALEEIVGDIEDEFDARAKRLRRVGDGVYLVDGAVDIDDLSEELPLVFDDPQYDTLAGFILMELGRIPEAGERVETSRAVFTVERLEGQRIAKVRVALKGAGRKHEAKT